MHIADIILIHNGISIIETTKNRNSCYLDKDKYSGKLLEDVFS